jgi:trimeric autotransporter adhesin
VNPNGADTLVMFLYGASSTLSGAAQTPAQDLGSAAASDAVSATVTGLSPSTTYYYQAVAQNSYGSTSGTIFSFTTTPAPYFSVLTGAPLSLAPGATTGNTSTLSVTPWYGFTGTVSLACAITPVASNDPPTCTVTPAVTITGTNTETATLTVNTTAASALNRQLPKLWPGAGGTILACVALLFVSPPRRNWLRMLAWVALFAAIGGVGCGGGSNTSTGGGGGGGGGGSSNSGTSAGTYTVTITGSSGSITQTGTVALTVQ